MYFKVSSGLKNIIGKDLITDDYAAIFELIKNSFDAHASHVDIYFSNDAIYVVDDGKGMTYNDIANKWLFVAYSAKQDGSEDSLDVNKDYRANLQANKRYAGSKGVGRFSCDRLGRSLVLQSKSADENDKVEQLDVNWGAFEAALTDEFVHIPVTHNSTNKFDLPEWVIPPTQHGTALIISGLRDSWPRKKLQDLKASLAKLINPFGAKERGFSIILHAPNEENEDQEIRCEYKTKGEDVPPYEIINGAVENFIFQALEEKTTWLRSWIDQEKKNQCTELTDRGKLIYRVSEPLAYSELLDSDFECNIFYLNRAAKVTFSRRMNINSVNFGSIFLFKNGFRVYPIGEPTDDSFGIDRRKQQGYARFLGTRDVIGRIDVYGDESKFKESSSRDKGLIETLAVKQLEECFWKQCLIRLENYVVGVNWKLKYDMDLEDASFLSGDEAKAKVIDVLAKLADSPNITVEYYAEDILTVINNKTSGFDKTIDNLTTLAGKIGNHKLVEQAQVASKKYQEMQKAQVEAIAYAEKEREARRLADQAANKITAELKQEKEKNLFLTSQQTRDKDLLENLHHQVIIYASNAINQIEASLINLKQGNHPTIDELQETFENLRLLNQQVISASRFATTANFKMESNSIEEDLSQYISQYIERICPIHESRIIVQVNNQANGFKRRFKPIEVSIVLDNLIDNASKAGASHILFELSKKDGNVLEILVKDDGFGLDSSITIPDSIFEKGITTTYGSGLGLHHVKQLLEGMGSSISLKETNANGTIFELKVYK
jgi:signal transduction histidine kinase